MAVPIPSTTNDLDIKEKQRRLRQHRKLSQIFGEVPRDDTEQPHLEGCNGPVVEPSASTDHPQQQRQRHIRISQHTLIESDSPSHPFRFPLRSRPAETNNMSLQPLGSSRDALGRSTSTRYQPALPSHINQLESKRVGLRRSRRAGSTGSTTGSDESSRGAGQPSLFTEENRLTRSSSLRLINRQARAKDKSRRQSALGMDTDGVQTHSRRSTEFSGFTPKHSQRRSVTLWTRRKIAKDDPAHQHRFTADQGQEDDGSPDSHLPLTEAQRILSIRRGRKLAQLFGTEPPTALYRVTPPFEDESPESPSAITGGSIEYLALPSSDFPPLSCIYSEDFSPPTTISPISTSFTSSGSTVDPFQESENEQSPATPVIQSQTPDDTPATVQSQDLHDERSNDSATMTFRRRRLQAAKLSRFFGIAYNDLASPVAGSRSQSKGKEAPSAEVGVRIQERGWFWGRTEGGQRDGRSRAQADMNDVIALLRQMPRA